MLCMEKLSLNKTVFNVLIIKIMIYEICPNFLDLILWRQTSGINYLNYFILRHSKRRWWVYENKRQSLHQILLELAEMKLPLTSIIRVHNWNKNWTSFEVRFMDIR